MSHSVGLRIALWITLLSAVAACSTVGEKTFSCPGRPAGVHCMTTTEVYEATENSDFVAPTASHPLGDKPSSRERNYSKRTGASATGSQNRDPHSAADRPSLAPAADKPIPIRTPAKVLRAWIAPWEDSHGVLHGGGYQFVEIETRRWSVGESEGIHEPVRAFAIQKVDPTESVGRDPAASATRTGVSEKPKQPTAQTSPKLGASSWSTTSSRESQPPP